MICNAFDQRINTKASQITACKTLRECASIIYIIGARGQYLHTTKSISEEVISGWKILGILRGQLDSTSVMCTANC